MVSASFHKTFISEDELGERDQKRKGEGDVALQKKPQTKKKKPRKYSVLLHNDDYTTMEFVIHILESTFRKSPAEATAIMYQIHEKGRGIAGVFSREIAETRVEQVHAQAKRRSCPLKASFEPC